MLSELRRANQTVLLKHGCFYVPKGKEDTEWLVFKAIAAQKVRMYTDHFEALGWTLRSQPVVKKVRTSEGNQRAVLDSRGDVALRMSADNKMRTDHPWYKPDADMYEVTAWFSKPNKLTVFELSDKHLSRLIQSGRLPASIALAE